MKYIVRWKLKDWACCESQSRVLVDFIFIFLFSIAKSPPLFLLPLICYCHIDFPFPLFLLHKLSVVFSWFMSCLVLFLLSTFNTSYVPHKWLSTWELMGTLELTGASELTSDIFNLYKNNMNWININRGNIKVYYWNWETN